jgi:hypothetical protein
MPRNSIPPAIRFWRFVWKTETCWVWTGGYYVDGYGMFGISKGASPVRAHRFSWELYNGISPGKLYVCHLCDNPACVRPDHLFLGTQGANLADMIAKKIMPRGQNRAWAKFTTEQISELRSAYRSGVNQYELAKRYGVEQTTVSAIIRRKTWRHIT